MPSIRRPSVAPRPPPLTPVRRELVHGSTRAVALEDQAQVLPGLRFKQNVKVDRVALELDLAHPRPSQLRVSLVSPSGREVVLHDRARALKGSYDVSKAMAGEHSAGAWRLRVEDLAHRHGGTLRSWKLRLSGVEAARPRPPANLPIVVVLDGGVNHLHRDLDGAMWRNTLERPGNGKDDDRNGIVDDVVGFNVGHGVGDPFIGEFTGHATHVAGIIGAEDNGIGATGGAAGKARILSIGGVAEGDGMLRNFERAVDYLVALKQRGENVRVINASFGEDYSKRPRALARFDRALRKLAENDILLVAAAPNARIDVNKTPGDRPSASGMANVISVAALDKSGTRLWSESGFGDKYVDLAALGEEIVSSTANEDGRDGWLPMSGTSMAAPAVSAAAAQLFARYPKLTAAQVKDLLVRSVDRQPALVGKVRSGGRLNVARALELAARL